MTRRLPRCPRPFVGSSVIRVLTAAAFLCLISPTLAQEAGLRGDTRMGPAVGMDVAGYALAPGDVVKVSVYREPDLSASYMISQTGTISMHFAERIQAAGLTLDQLRDAIVDQLRVYIKRPVVQVQIDTDNSVRRVYVGGHIQTPGQVAVPFGGTVAEAVISAGITPSSDLSAVRLNRPGEASIAVDLGGLQGEGTIDRTHTVRDGDVVYVPRHEAEFSVLGMVANPGSYPIAPDQADRVTVLRALNEAGGYTQGADLSGALLLRADGSSEKVNLRALLLDGDMTQNRPIRSQDLLVVREAGQITVAGEVGQPGVFQVAQPIGVLEAIARSSGFTPNADLKRASILGDQGSRSIDLEGLWWRGDTSQNVQIAPGETLLVPERDPEEVLVVGALQTPGTVDLRAARDRTVLRVVQAAQPTVLADLSRITIHRLAAEGPLVADVRAAMEQGNMEGNVALQAGDIVFVPELKKVYAIGAFMTAGVYPLTPDLTLTELIAQAGSFRPDALPSKMRLIRPATEAAEVTQIDFRRIENGVDTEAYFLQEGDVVFVPSKGKGGLSWASIRDAIWASVGLLRVF